MKIEGREREETRGPHRTERAFNENCSISDDWGSQFHRSSNLCRRESVALLVMSSFWPSASLKSRKCLRAKLSDNGQIALNGTWCDGTRVLSGKLKETPRSAKGCLAFQHFSQTRREGLHPTSHFTQLGRRRRIRLFSAVWV